MFSIFAIGKSTLSKVMATVTLNLPIESGIAERIIQYANNRKTSVSSIVENYFAFVTSSAQKQNEVQDISPLVQSFSIENVNIPADFDYKKELANARNEKYS
jgi:hypothetical protein